MISRLYNFWHIIKGSLGFIPAILCFLYFVLTFGLFELESKYFSDIELPNLFFSGSYDDAKAVIIALLSSMITMSTLAISITIVALSLAASQLGPRLIKTFMGDRKTQLFIGLFFGAVIACFMLTIILHDAQPEAASPQITISVVFALCFANLFVLLAFVDHVAKSIIADNVILKVSGDLINAVERLTLDKDQEPEFENNDAPRLWPSDFDEKRERLYFKRSGYVQNIDYNKIVCLCAEHDLHGEIRFKSGHFLVSGEDGVRFSPASNMNEHIQSEVMACFIIGNTRTATQDIEYSIRHLVEIAIRALSSGINDSFTAITVLDRLSEALAILFSYNIPTKWMMDKDGTVRLKAKRVDENEILLSAFDQIRYNARTNLSVTQHILDKLNILSDLARSEAQKRGLIELLKDMDLNLIYFKDQTHTYKKMKVQLDQILKINTSSSL